jgi:hypothetical protein
MLFENVHTHSTATPIPTQLTSTGTAWDFPLLSKLQNQANLCLTVMVMGWMLQDVLCSNSNLMSSPCVCDMECPQEDSAVPGVVIWLIKGDHWYLSQSILHIPG